MEENGVSTKGAPYKMPMEQMMLLCALILVVCIAAGRVSQRLGVPSLLIFMALGMLFGSDGLFKIPFSSFRVAEHVCSAALIFIMFYGGFGTRWEAAKPIAVKAVALSTGGVAVTAFLTGAFCHLALGFSMTESFLTGAVISSTDAASVFSILRSKKLSLKNNSASLLEVESGSNDPASYMLTMIALSLMGIGEGGPVLSLIAAQLFFGAALGFLVAVVTVFALRRLPLSDGLDAIFVTAAALLSYALPAVLGGNGYLGAYLAGIVIGNAKIPRKAALVHYFDGITGLTQIAIFFLLGLLSFPSYIPAILPEAIGIVLFLTLIARPAAVFLLLLPLRCPVRQCLLVSWSGLRGAASIVFAIMAMANGADIGHDLFHIVFCISLFSVAIQGTLLPIVAKSLDMVDTEDDVSKTFNDYVDQKELHLMQFCVRPEHPWAGHPLRDCPLPYNALVVMIRRGDETIIPNGETIVKPNDLLVLSTPDFTVDSGVSLRELPVEAGSPWIGKPIKELNIPQETLIVLVKRPDGTTVVPKGGTIIHRGDTLVVNEL